MLSDNGINVSKARFRKKINEDGSSIVKIEDVEIVE